MSKKEVLEYHEKYHAGVSERLPSIVEFPQRRMPANLRKQVIDFMLNKSFANWRELDATEYDAWTGKPMFTLSQGFSYEDWYWCDQLALFVRDHDVQLPDEFVEDIMAYYDAGGTVTPMYDWENHHLPDDPFDVREPYL